jgi:chromosome partitioning protein
MKIAVANLKGGVGKTTTALYVAALLAEVSNEPVVLADADPQASAAHWLKQHPLQGVLGVDTPSQRLVEAVASVETDEHIVFDTPPGSADLVLMILHLVDAVIIPSRVGEMEEDRVLTTARLIPPTTPYGIVLCGARRNTTAFRDTYAGWGQIGYPVWGVIPERTAVANPADAKPLSPDAMDAYRGVLSNLQAALHERSER